MDRICYLNSWLKAKQKQRTKTKSFVLNAKRQLSNYLFFPAQAWPNCSTKPTSGPIILVWINFQRDIPVFSAYKQ